MRQCGFTGQIAHIKVNKELHLVDGASSISMSYTMQGLTVEPHTIK